MVRFFGKSRALAIGTAFLITGAMVAMPQAHAAKAKDSVKVTPVRAEALQNVPGKDLTAIVVTYPPGGSTPVHHHTGTVFAYVLSGAIRSQVSGQGPAKVFTAGQSFVEPPGSTHLVSANASKTKPAKFLVVFIADKGAKLTTMGPAGK